MRIRRRRHGVGLTILGVEKLIDDDRVDIDLIGRELLDQSLSFVEREELGDCSSERESLISPLDT